MRKMLAILLNVLFPGSGLIALRRDWLGFVLALLFVLCAQIGLWGWLIVPASIPWWITAGALVAAGMVWLGAQFLLWNRLRRAFAPGIEHEVERLCREAREALDAKRYGPAEELLQVALALNDEHVTVNALWAELMTALGRFLHARRAWRRVVQLARDATQRREAADALAALP